MNTITKMTVNTAIACMSLAFLGSCSNEPKDSKEVAQEINDDNFDKKGEKDADCLVNAYSSNLFEIKVSENAAMNATTADVKQLAGMIVEAHTKMNADVQRLANEKQVMLPADLTEEQRKKIEDLSDKTGLDYDKAYVKMMKDKHEDAVKTYEKNADKCVDADIKNWSAQTVPEVKSHLAMVETTEGKIKDMK